MWFGRCNNGLRTMVLLLALTQAFAHRECGHEYMQKQVKAVEETLNLQQKSVEIQRESSFSSIRIHVEYYKSEVPEADLKYIKERVIPGSIKWFENALNVRRLTSPIVLNPDLGITDRLRESSYQPPSYLFNQGVEADYIFFIGAVSDMSLGWVGAATHLLQDSNTGQPIVGMFDLNYYHSYFGEFSFEDVLSTTIHEMAHALGFSSNLYPYYLKPNGELYREDEVIKVEFARGVETQKIVTPKVVETARKAFGCNDLDGIELEMQGGGGTAGSHWEKRVMYNDFMGPDADMNDVVYSDITLALFEDMGWYTANYQYTTPLDWANQRGCSFLEKPCVVNEEPQFDVFCVDDTYNKCDFNRLNKGACGISAYKEIPKSYQYFFDKSIGGSDLYLDFCPVIKQTPGGNCRGIDSKPTELNQDYGEQACENCRCIEGTYSKNDEPHDHVACHWVECINGHTLIHVGDSVVECPSTGGEVEVPGYNGVLYCPKWDEVCKPVTCMNACSGIGICNRGVCECPDGSKGGDCGDVKKDFSYRDPLPQNLIYAQRMMAEVSHEDSGKMLGLMSMIAVFLLF